MHRAGPAPVASGNERVQTDGVSDRPRYDDQQHRRGKDRDVATRLPPGSAHRHPHREECEDQKADRRMHERGGADQHATGDESDESCIVTGRGRQEDEHRHEAQRGEHGLELECRGRGDQVRIHRDDRCGQQPDARVEHPARKEEDEQDRQRAQHGLHVLCRAHYVAVGNRRVPHRPHDGRDEHRIPGRIERRRFRGQRRLVVSPTGDVFDVDEGIRVPLSPCDRFTL